LVYPNYQASQIIILLTKLDWPIHQYFDVLNPVILVFRGMESWKTEILQITVITQGTRKHYAS
jgi:hypothetical protein